MQPMFLEKILGLCALTCFLLLDLDCSNLLIIYLPPYQGPHKKEDWVWKSERRHNSSMNWSDASFFLNPDSGLLGGLAGELGLRSGSALVGLGETGWSPGADPVCVVDADTRISKAPGGALPTNSALDDPDGADNPLALWTLMSFSQPLPFTTPLSNLHPTPVLFPLATHSLGLGPS